MDDGSHNDSQDGLHLYHYDLPPHLIAQSPPPERDRSRLMLLRQGHDGAAHHTFNELPALLGERFPGGCLLVVNNTRVLPRRLSGSLPGGGSLDALLVEEERPGIWRAMIRNARRIKVGMTLRFAGGKLSAQAMERTEEGHWRLEFHDAETLPSRLERHGLAPLPPYIRRHPGDFTQQASDRGAYQTVFAAVDGAIAAPTAGFHFTPAVLDDLRSRGIALAELTLHVGIGTFAKIQDEDPSSHVMHREWFEISQPTGAAIREAKARRQPVIAVGTTTVRALESWSREAHPEGFAGWSSLFIRPPFSFRVVDGLITNFHQPRTTLMLMVSAFHGRERILAAYGEAIDHDYRFFSYGDCMAILPTEG